MGRRSSGTAGVAALCALILAAGPSTPSAPANVVPRRPPTGLIGFGQYSPQRGNELRTVTPSGRMRTIASGEITSFAWSPGGSRLVLARNTSSDEFESGVIEVMRGPAAPRGADDVIPTTEHATGIRDLQPAWSPDGRRIAFSRRYDGPVLIGMIVVVRPNGTQEREITSPPFKGPPGPDRTFTPTVDYDPRWSPDSSKVAFVRSLGDEQDLVVVDRDGSHPRSLTTDGRSNASFSWSPDGQWLVFARGDTTAGDLFKIRPDGSDLTQVTRDGEPKFTPRWSPDGRHIVYAQGGPDLELDLFAIAPDGSDRQCLTRLPGREIGPTWSPDSRHLAFSHFAPDFPDAGYTLEEPGELIVLSIRSRRARVLVEGKLNVFPIAWQPSADTP